MNNEDLQRLADRLHKLADLVATRGIPALTTAALWRGHMRAANYDPNTGPGLHHDTYTDPDGTEHVVAIPHDPTGEASTTTADQRRHPDLVAAFKACDIVAANLTRLIINTAPKTTVSTDPDEPGDGWCHSCYRDNRYMQPEDTHADGRIKHKNLCAWCAGFIKDYQRRPPIELLRQRHEGRRITTAAVADALKPKKPTPKKKRKNRRAA